MMGHRMNLIRRPSSFLLIPVGSPGRDLHFESAFARSAQSSAAARSRKLREVDASDDRPEQPTARAIEMTNETRHPQRRPAKAFSMVRHLPLRSCANLLIARPARIRLDLPPLTRAFGSGSCSRARTHKSWPCPLRSDNDRFMQTARSGGILTPSDFTVLRAAATCSSSKVR
jgi:hypothetical protein